MSFMALAVLLLSGLTALAQNMPVRGVVMLKKADGSESPLVGGVVEVYRTDAKGKLPSAKTDKKGAFAFAGFPLGQTFALVVNAPNIRSEITPNIKAGMETIAITVYEGDGKSLTEDEVRQALTVKPKANGSNSSGEQPTAADVEAAKKAKAEYDKQVAETTANNKKIEDTNAIVKKALDDGNKAYTEKNYELALASYDQGIAAQPDYIGSTPVLLNNKSLVLVNRATGVYNQNVKAEPATKATAMQSVKKDFEDAITATDKSLEILKTAPANDPNQKSYDAQKFMALSQRKEAYRLMIKTGADRNRGKEAATAFQEYIAAEPDAKKKSDAQLAYAEALQDSNEFELAVTEFEKILAQDPNNVEALVGAGLSLVNVGYVNNDKAKFQQAADYLQKFADLAPETHKYKADAKGIIETLKKEQNVTPQKNTKKKN